MQKLGQKELLREMIYLDSQRDNIYKDLPPVRLIL